MSIPPIKARKIGIQAMSDLRPLNKLCNEIGHLKMQKNTKQGASKLGTTVAVNLSDSNKISGRKIICDKFFH